MIKLIAELDQLKNSLTEALNYSLYVQGRIKEEEIENLAEYVPSMVAASIDSIQNQLSNIVESDKFKEYLIKENKDGEEEKL